MCMRWEDAASCLQGCCACSGKAAVHQHTLRAAPCTQVHAGAHGPIFVHQDVHETGKTAGGGGAHLQLGTPLKVTRC